MNKIIKTSYSVLLLALLCLSCSLSNSAQHLFEFNECGGTYNGKAFTMADSIDHMVEVFGPYDRLNEQPYMWSNLGMYYSSYIWDNLGIVITYFPMINCPLTGEPSRETKLKIIWKLDIPKWVSDDLVEKVKAATPKEFFHGNIIVGGVPLGGGMKMDEFGKKSSMLFEQHPMFSENYDYELQLCPNIKNPNCKFQYIIIVPKNNVEEFVFCSIYKL